MLRHTLRYYADFLLKRALTRNTATSRVAHPCKQKESRRTMVETSSGLPLPRGCLPCLTKAGGAAFPWRKPVSAILLSPHNTNLDLTSLPHHGLLPSSILQNQGIRKDMTITPTILCSSKGCSMLVQSQQNKRRATSRQPRKPVPKL